jgi:pimeloyl-ACP methyl ester carboxylesterase
MTTMPIPVTRKRIVALALIALTTLGLAYLHFAGGSTSVSVPSGAHAGQLTLKHCTYGNEAADCGTLVVPENRHNPHSRLIALPITRIRAHTPNPGAAIFRLQGGPGLSNMDFPQAKRFTARHDFVLVGYRGVDGSSRLDCREVSASRDHSRDLLSRASLASDASAYRACAKRLQADGVDLAGYSLPERVEDLELARQRLGYGPIDLISESAGTRTAMIYAWRYPQSIHRSVMVAANPPGNYLWNPKTTDEQIHRYAVLCAKDQDCRSRTPDLAASIHSAYAKIPSRFLFLPIKKGNVRIAGFFGLMNSTNDGGGPLAGPKTIDTLLSIDKGNGAAGAWLLSLFAGAALPHGQVWGDVASIARIDAAYGKRLFANGVDHGSVLGNPGTRFLWSGGRLLNSWPANPDEKEYNSVRNSNVRTLLINGQLDFAAPPENATRQLLPHLPNGRQVVLPKLGHADDFWAYEPDASTHLIDSYLDSGRVDISRYTTNQLDFTPSNTQGRIAEIVAAVFVGFGALLVLSVLWFARRLRRGATFGQKTSVAVRSLFALLLGFGGWCVGVLIALVALPTVPITDSTLAVVSIAPPVALAVHTGWFRSTAPRGVGALTATACATVGAWLGYQVPHAPGFGAVTAIIGATLAANLGLIAVDIATPVTRDATAPGSARAETAAGRA